MRASVEVKAPCVRSAVFVDTDDDDAWGACLNITGADNAAAGLCAPSACPSGQGTHRRDARAFELKDPQRLQEKTFVAGFANADGVRSLCRGQRKVTLPPAPSLN
jgi:hypothetical protein